jgi:hypothetical protein
MPTPTGSLGCLVPDLVGLHGVVSAWAAKRTFGRQRLWVRRNCTHFPRSLVATAVIDLAQSAPTN